MPIDEFTLARIERMTTEERIEYVKRCYEDATRDLRRTAENLRQIQQHLNDIVDKRRTDD